MTITVTTHKLQVSAPVTLSLLDRSGAHVVLTLVIEGRAPISHAFEHDEGVLEVPADLAPGRHKCSFVAQAFRHGALNGRYQVRLEINGQIAATARGAIPSGRSNDVGFGDFVLTVV